MMALLLVISALIAAALFVWFLAPARLGNRWPLVVLSGFAALSEMQIERLIGPNVDRLVDLALGGTAVFGFLIMFFIERPNLELYIGRPIGWLGLFVLGGLLLSPFSLAPVATIQRSVAAIAVIGAVALLVRRYSFLHVVAALSLGTCVLVAGSVVWEVVGPGSPPSEIPGFIDTGFANMPRHLGLTHQPNQLGRVSATLLITGALLAKDRGYQLAGWGFQVVAFAGLFFAQSRTAIVVGLAVLAVTHIRNGWGRAVAVVVAAGITVGLWLWSTGLVGVDSLTRTGAGTEELTTATGRTTVWRLAWELALEQPLTGVGAFASEQALAPSVVDGRAGFEAHDAHNLILNVFLTQGLLGLLLLFGFVLSSCANILKGHACRGAGLMLLLAAGLGLTENLFWKSNSTFIFLAVGAAGAVLGPQVQNIGRGKPADYGQAMSRIPQPVKQVLI